MKILYIAHFEEGSGWSQAAIDYVLALDSIGIDVVCRNIKLTPQPNYIPERIKELLSKPLSNIDYCLQHVLPHHLVATKKFKKNIALFVSETDTIKNTSWYQNLYEMDETWVPNNSNRSALINDGIKNTKYVPYAFDITKYKNIANRINLYTANNKFKFYYIGDFNDRKNIAGIIRSFNSEFCNGENVSMVFKIKQFGFSPERLNQEFSKFSESIKANLRIHNNISMFPQEIVITADVDNNVINSLHHTCDCFINISHGEGWSIPAFEAMAIGKTPICSNEGGPKEFINDNDKNTGTLINGVYSVCTHNNPAFKEIFTGRDNWFIPSELEAKKAMRYYYENRNNIDRTNGFKQAEKFSYENVANKIKDALNE
ncbi:MAG: glycosyltransferase family 1 protein [Proteobacteria bacterium]|nr:glycosyltransferase family 1 protein [Pseudomonadota bacterium]NBP13686.1 glycosyltransferase family 1 protein [bacterium]